MTSWYVQDTAGGYVITTQAGNAVAGPFTTQGKARAWENAHPIPGSGQGGSGSGDPWWIEYPNLVPGVAVSPIYVQAPAPGPQAGGNIARVYGPFKTKVDAEKANAGISLANQKPSSQSQSWQQAIGDFLSRLGQANTWIRVAEVLLGLGLIIVGLAKIASGTAAGKAAVKVGKAAAIL